LDLLVHISLLSAVQLLCSYTSN